MNCDTTLSTTLENREKKQVIIILFENHTINVNPNIREADTSALSSGD